MNNFVRFLGSGASWIARNFSGDRWRPSLSIMCPQERHISIVSEWLQLPSSTPSHDWGCVKSRLCLDLHKGSLSRLVELHLIPLHYFFELQDVIFFISCLKHPDPSFNNYDFVSFSSQGTCSATHTELLLNHSSTCKSHHIYFTHLARLWNFSPPLDLSLSFTAIKNRFDPDDVCIPLMFCAHARIVIWEILHPCHYTDFFFVIVCLLCVPFFVLFCLF